MKIIRSQDYLTNQWAGGITRQLYIYPENGSLAERSFMLRISSAVIDLTESEFSDFSGFIRYIMPLDGDIRLIMQGRRIDLEKDNPFRFDGREKVYSENTKGATDFNIIYQENLSVDVCVVTEGIWEAAEHQTIVFALEDCCVNGHSLGRHETLVANEGVSLEGKAVVIRF
ncbi:MAG: HutD family protein [Prevotella sp.]|nr:HutD family protein [Prevotella sp.]